MELTPDFLITTNDDFPKERVISIKTNDEAGFVSDSCEIVLDDYDDALSISYLEAKIEVSLGYKETGIKRIGAYFVKEIYIDGARKTVTIRCNAINRRMRSQKTKNNKPNLGDILNETAEECDFTPAISNEMSGLEVSDDVQIAESNINYLTRMSRKYGAVAKPTDGHLVFNELGKGKSATGQNLTTQHLKSEDVSSYSCSFMEAVSGETSGSVFANWYDANSGEYHLIKAGHGEPETELNEIFSTEEEAKRVANSKLKTKQSENKKMSLNTIGRPDLFAESPIVLQGFPKKIPDKWIIEKVEHSLDSHGFQTRIECKQ